MDFDEWAENQPLFNLNQAQRALEIERDYLREKLSRKVKRGELKRVERGKYTVHEDPRVYATYIENPSYLSFWSALRFYDLTTQEPTKLQVVTSKNRSDLENITFHSSSNMFGFSKHQYRGFQVRVADREKLMIDILMNGKVPVEDLGNLVEEIDIERTVEYCERIGSKTLNKRAGYLIQEFKNKEVEILKVEDRNYPLLDLTKPSNGDKDPEWGLEVNADLD